MAVTLTGSGTGLFTRLGRIMFVIKQIQAHQSDSPNGLKKEMEDVVAEYSAADSFMLSGLSEQILATQINAGNAIITSLRSAAKKTVIEMVAADTNKLPDRSLKTALVELIDQMLASPDDVTPNGTITSVATVKSASTGNGTILTSVTKPTSPDAGDQWANARAERIEYKCTTDAQESGTEGRETFSVRGEPVVSDARHPDFPDGSTAAAGAGSGAGGALRVTDPTENQQKTVARNMLVNSAFETFTVTNTPDNWTLNTGVVGTDIFEEGTVIYRGSKCLQLNGGAGGLKHDLSQALNTSGASTAIIKPERKYCVFARVSCNADTDVGIVRFSVKDGANSILNGGAAAVSEDISGTSFGGTFDLISFTFNSPLDVPATVKFVIEATTAIGNGDIFYIDDLCLCEMAQIGGASGTYAVVIPGSTAFIRGDIIHVAVSNDHVGEIQKYFDQLFGMYSMGLQLAVDASPTLVDGTIVA